MIHSRKTTHVLQRLFFFLIIVGIIALGLYQFFLKSKPFLKLPPSSYAVYSPDGEIIVLTCGGATSQETYPAAYIIDASNGTNLAQLDSSMMTYEAAFSPDGQLLITDAGRRLDIWDTDTWHRIMSLESSELICDLDYSPDKALLVLATCGPDGGHLSIIDANSGEELEHLLSYSVGWAYPAYSPNGNYVAAATDPNSEEGTLYVWNARTYQEFRHFSQGKSITDIAWSPDERMLATINKDGLLRIYDIATGETMKELPQSGNLRSISYSPDGRFIAVGGQQPTTIWDTTSWKKVGHLGEGNVSSIRYSPNGKFVVIANGNNPKAYTAVFKTLDTIPRSNIKGLFDRFFSIFEQ